MMECARHKGYTLIELLVVMTIIVLITSIAVPVLARGGLFSSDKSGIAARELYAQLRAASLRARTSNTETAIAYDVTLVQDSLFVGDGGSGSNAPINVVPSDYYASVTPPAISYPEVAGANWISTRPVLTETLFVRRLTINELKETDANGLSLAQALIDVSNSDEYGSYANLTNNMPFVPANAPTGRFESLPENTAVLINHPGILQTADDPVLADYAQFQNRTALQPIAIFYVIDDGGTYDVRRVVPKVQDDPRGLPDPAALGHWNNMFPAHVFRKSGALDSPAIDGPQRIRLNVGLKPDADFYDRYMVNEDAGDVVFTNEVYHDAAGDMTSPYFENYDLVAIDSEVTIFVPTGRVALEGNDENT